MAVSLAKKPELVTNLADIYKWAGVRSDVTWAQGMELPFEPFPHQVTCLNKALGTDRFGCYLDVGVGKSLIAILYSLFCIGNNMGVVLVVPPVLLDQFKEHWDSVEGNDRSFAIFRGAPKQRSNMVKQWEDTCEWPDMVALSFGMFRKYAGDLRKWGYEALVVDEAHAIKNPSTQIFKSVQRYIGAVEERRPVLLMTGTPIHNTLLDAYGLIKTLTPAAYMNKRHFERQHVVKRDMGSYSIVVGFRNTEMLHRALYHSAWRVIKEDVLSLETPTISTVPITLSDPHLKLYRKLLRERVLQVGEGRIIDALQASALRMQSLQLISTPEEYTSSKMQNAVHEGVEALLDSVGAATHEKVVLFCRFRKTIKALSERLKDYNPALVYGDSDTSEQVKKFKEDPKCRLLIAQYQAGGVGLSLEHQSSTVIFVEPTSVYGEFLQAGQRVHRAGQTKAVVIYILKILGTHSPKAITQMLSKSAVIKDVQQDRTSLLDELGL